jgi:hypothetical protein
LPAAALFAESIAIGYRSDQHRDLNCQADFAEVLHSMLTPPLEAGTTKCGFQRGRASALVK